jgi:hypothetical protein
VNRKHVYFSVFINEHWLLTLPITRSFILWFSVGFVPTDTEDFEEHLPHCSFINILVLFKSGQPYRWNLAVLVFHNRPLFSVHTCDQRWVFLPLMISLSYYICAASNSLYDHFFILKYSQDPAQILAVSYNFHQLRVTLVLYVL